MGALDGFYSTWNKAKATFGVGTPTDGSQHDGSSNLLKMKGMVESAQPDDRWQGSGSQAYAAANQKHADVYGKLADLDKKMATEVTNAANVVTNGRTKLDATKSWVDSAVNSLPASLNAQAREKSLIPIAREGISQVNNTVSTANGDMLKIGFRVTDLKNSFDELHSQQFGPGEKKDADGLSEQQARALTPEEQAERDVEATLNGTGTDGGQAERVDQVLSSIKPGEGLTPTQDAYLTKMQEHQKGMSVNDLKVAEQRLGDHKNVIADSWQLMSNDDVRYSGGAGDPPKGAASQLPDSVQQALRNADATTATESHRTPELANGDALKSIADIVKDGNPQFQTGTELDRQIIVATDKLMDKAGTMYTPDDLVATTQSLFGAVDDDHQIINDHLMGRNGMDANDFLKDINTVNWDDNGRAAGHLFRWTNEASLLDSESWIASETAEKYGNYLGSHPELNSINGQTLGQHNPELVQGYAHGLVPYISDIADLSTAQKDGDAYNNPDAQHPADRPVAKGIFSVLSTDPTAYNEFNGAAMTQAVAASHAWAHDVGDVKASASLQANDSRLLDAQTLTALSDVGTANAANELGKNAHDMYQQQKSAYGTALSTLTNGTSVIPTYGQIAGPALNSFGTLMQDTFLGKEPSSDTYAHTVEPMTQGDAARFALNALLAKEVPLVNNTNGEFNASDYFEPNDSAHPEKGYKPVILDSSGLAANDISGNRAEQVLTQVLRDTLPPGTDPVVAMTQKYQEIAENLKPNEAKKPGER